ncbi:hypothetical protein CsSME_00013038 [Camellia sinensis var. sinensis]
MASERAAYSDLCAAAVEQFKLSLDFQMAIDAIVARSLAREGEGGAGPSNVVAAELVEGQTKKEIIQRFQHYYKHEMSMYWNNGWTSFKYRAEELFPDMDFSGVRLGEKDIAQIPLDEGVQEEDLASSGEEESEGGAV